MSDLCLFQIVIKRLNQRLNQIVSQMEVKEKSKYFKFKFMPKSEIFCDSI